MATLNIYIKGTCDYANDRKGAYAVIVTNNIAGKEGCVYYSSRSYEYAYNNFVTEIEGITDALEHITPPIPDVVVFTNNKPLASILSKEKYGYDYDEELHRYWDLVRGKNVVVNWVKKSENNKWMQNADKQANKLTY